MTIIVFGLPGSGKSFFASKLADVIGAEYIKSDSIRAQIPNKNYTLRNKRQVYDAMLEKTKEMLEQKRIVVVDATFYKHDVREKFKSECKNLGSIHFIEVIVDEPLIKERLKTPRNDSDADFAVYRKIKIEWEPLLEEHLVLQSTTDNVEEMLDKATAYLQLKNDKRPG